MTAQHHGFAAAARGRGADRAAWQSPTGSPDPVGDYRAAAAELLVAFAEADVSDRAFVLPEIGGDQPIPGGRAVAFHFLDYFVHGWDIARTIGRPFDPDDDLARAALDIARLVPDGAARTRPGAAFGPQLPACGGSPLDDVLRLLGRSPSWTNLEGCLPTG